MAFTALLNTTGGLVSVPDIHLNGRQSKIAVTDYNFGNHTLLYSTAEVLTHGVFDVDVLVLYLLPGQVGQFAFKNAPDGLSYIAYGRSGLNSSIINGTTAYTYTQTSGQTTIQFGDGLLVYLLDRNIAWQFWAPPTTSNPDVLPTEQIFVLGPYLVRNASTNSSSGVVRVSGDSNVTTTIEVYTGDNTIKTVEWNGIHLNTAKTSWGSITATIPGVANRALSLPALVDWKSNDSLPEIDPSYDDSHWTICDKNTTLSPMAPLTLPVLFSSDYGYYTGAKVYRGYFDGRNATAANLTASGGLAFGWNAWLNGELVGGSSGVASLTTTTSVLEFANISLKAEDNVLTVVVDYHGHDESRFDFHNYTKLLIFKF